MKNVQNMKTVNITKFSGLTYILVAFLLNSTASSLLSQPELHNECPNAVNTSNNKNQIIALILARGGSKGIRYKNLAKLGNVTLLGNALRAINNCRNCFEQVWVSTDDELIARESYRYNVHVHFRNAHSARDEATSVEAVQEFLKGHPHIQNIALVQCTSVFIRGQYLEAAVAAFTSDRNVDCVFSVQRSWKLRWQQVADSGRLTAINFNPKKRPRRQDWNGELIETGMFYFARRQLVEVDGILQNDRCKFVEIDARHTLEIDEYYQLDLANALIQFPDW